MLIVMRAVLQALVGVFGLMLITVAHADERPTPYFYKVTKSGSTSYLLGTIHRNVALSELSSSIIKALKSSNSVFVEVVFQEDLVKLYFSDPWLFRERFELEFLGISPQQHTKEAPTSETLKRLNALNFPMELNRLVRNDMCDLASDSRIDFSQPKSLDFEIQRYAHDHKIPLGSLDPPTMVEDLKKISEDYLACNLSGYLARESTSELQNNYQKMRNDYLTQTLDGLMSQ